MNRIRVKALIDSDAVSPDSIRAANEYLTSQIEERAAALGVAINWNTWRSYISQMRGGDLRVVQYAKIIKVRGADRVFR